MYIHPAFQASRDHALQLLRDRAFGSFVVPSSDAAPQAAHVPFLTHEEADGSLRIEFHVAKANPIHALIGVGRPALLICTGPDAYISPDWYRAVNEVPTWTYTAVHLTGEARAMPQSDNHAHVERMAAYFESRITSDASWTTARVEPHRIAAMMQAVVTIEFRVTELKAQFKLIQHKDEHRHLGVIEGLRAQKDANAQAVADLMQQTLDQRSSPLRTGEAPR